MASTLLLLLLAITTLSYSSAGAGRWRVLKKSIGVSAMHMALLPNDRIVVFDRTNSGPSNLSLPQSKCATSSSLEPCTAHSVEFDSSDRAVRALTILTDTWCSSGALSNDGVLVQTGGFQAGERVVRFLGFCSGCDWVEVSGGLASPRWYASNQVLPDGRIVVVGGKSAFSYEFVPNSHRGPYALPFLEETRFSSKVPNNLYPFLHLSPDGNLFVFANDRAVLLDYVNNRIVRRFPPMPTRGDGGIAVSRNYPSTGSSALLPIFLSRNGTGFTGGVVVLICGGTPSDSNIKAGAREFVPAVKSCGKIDITEKGATWQMETMPVERTMGDMIMLPTGDILIVNGARSGTAGWNSARDPVLTPVLYRTRANGNARFEVMSPSPIPRLYHSTAHLLSDGRVLVGGSNPNRNYNFSTLFPTELSLEAFYPPYLTTSEDENLRPEITSVWPGVDLRYKQKISVQFRSKRGWKNNNEVYVTVVAPSFTTHSLAMNQRLLVLDAGDVRRGKSDRDYAVETETPGTPELAPPGYYLLFVVVDGVPTRGLWVRIH